MFCIAPRDEPQNSELHFHRSRLFDLWDLNLLAFTDGTPFRSLSATRMKPNDLGRLYEPQGHGASLLGSP